MVVKASDVYDSWGLISNEDCLAIANVAIGHVARFGFFEQKEHYALAMEIQAKIEELKAAVIKDQGFSSVEVEAAAATGELQSTEELLKGE